jgi:hypothetical protein
MDSGSQRWHQALHHPVVHTRCVVVQLGVEAESLCHLEISEGQGFIRLYSTKIREGSWHEMAGMGCTVGASALRDPKLWHCISVHVGAGPDSIL